jgi:hypothetical protein
VSDYPHMLPSSNRAARDRIEAALDDLNHTARHELCGSYQRWEHVRRVAAGALRKAFMPELARMASTEDTLARVRRVVRSAPEDGSVSVRRLLDALYGEERR